MANEYSAVCRGISHKSGCGIIVFGANIRQLYHNMREHETAKHGGVHCRWKERRDLEEGDTRKAKILASRTRKGHGKKPNTFWKNAKMRPNKLFDALPELLEKSSHE